MHWTLVYISNVPFPLSYWNAVNKQAKKSNFFLLGKSKYLWEIKSADKTAYIYFTSVQHFQIKKKIIKSQGTQQARAMAKKGSKASAQKAKLN